MGDRKTGVVKTLVREKGFGFIRVDGTSSDVFFHRSALGHGEFEDLQEENLANGVQGSRLSFTVEPGRQASGTEKKKGPRAENISVLALA